MDRGDEQLEQGHPEQALTLYLGANEIMHVPTTGVEVARTYARLGRLVEARDAALEVLRIPIPQGEPRPFKLAREAAEELARSLSVQIPLLRIEIAPPAAAQRFTLSLDGRTIPPAAATLPQALNPTEHRVRAAAPGYRPAEQLIALGRGERRALTLTLEPEAAPAGGGAAGRAGARSLPNGTLPGEAGAVAMAPRDRDRLAPPARFAGGTPTPVPWPVWLGVGVGGAGLLTGTVAGIVSLVRAGDAREHCRGNDCTADARQDRDAALTAAHVSNLGFALGAAGVAGVATWWLVGRDADSAAPRLRIAPGRDGAVVQLEGRLW